MTSLTKPFMVRRLPAIEQDASAWRSHFTNDFPPLPPVFAAAMAQVPPAASRGILAMHMDELLPGFDALQGAMPGTGALLAEYNAPPFWAGCSVTISQREGRPVMLRNYDMGLDGCPGILRYEDLPNGGWIIGSAEAGWGYLDGLNDRGLAVAITFGGRFEVGDGFAVPILVRYLLQAAGTVAEAIALLQRLPHRVPQNFLLLDRSGAHAVLFASPDRGVIVLDGAACVTNHQGKVEVPEHGTFVRTVERLEYLEGHSGQLTLADLMQPPLYQQQYAQQFGTLYSLELDPVGQAATYAWPDLSVRLTPQSQAEEFTVTYTDR